MRERSAKVRALGAELRTVRAQSGMTLQDVADRLDVSISSLSRSETGLRRTGLEEIASLLTLYSVTGSERERLLHLARRAADPAEWWETSEGRVRLGPALRTFEARARRIEEYSPMLVPGLVQTQAYMWALMRSANVPLPEAEQRVKERVARQKLLERRTGPDYLLVLDEAVVRRPCGGRDVMADQIHRLIKVAGRPNVCVQVIPFNKGTYSAAGPYFLMSFANEPQVVYLEHERASGFLDKASDTKHFAGHAERLRKFALPPQESADFLRFLVADQYRR